MSKPTQNDVLAAQLERLKDVNAKPKSREALQAKYGQVWNTQQLQEDFRVDQFLAPWVYVRRKSDGKKGTLTFQHNPRFYFDFIPEE